MTEQDIHALLATAASTGADADYDALFLALDDAEVFFNVTTANGGDDTAPVSTPMVVAGPSLKAVLVCTSRDNEKLNRPFAGLAWQEALRMVAAMSEADGMVLLGGERAWVGLDKDKVRALLALRP